MKVIFADTGYWVALLNPKDDWNARANEVSRAMGKFRIVTSEMVLDELLAALSKVAVRPMAIRGVEAIRSNPNIEVVPQTSLQFGDAFGMYRRMPGRSEARGGGETPYSLFANLENII